MMYSSSARRQNVTLFHFAVDLIRGIVLAISQKGRICRNPSSGWRLPSRQVFRVNGINIVET